METGQKIPDSSSSLEYVHADPPSQDDSLDDVKAEVYVLPCLHLVPAREESLKKIFAGKFLSFQRIQSDEFL